MRKGKVSEMKRIVFAIALAVACGCDVECPKEPDSRVRIHIDLGEYVTVFKFEGHQYLTRCSGGITHSASCPCRKGSAE